jgi:polyisoprenoid-binding protein YceI
MTRGGHLGGEDLSTLTIPSIATGTYAIDPVHSGIGFTARHAMVTKVRGSFDHFAGTGYFDVDQPSRSHLELSIDASSVDTRNADRDAHLRSKDFFDTEEFPGIFFASTSVEWTSDLTYRVTGDLTIKGMTRPVTIDFEYTGTSIDQNGAQRIGFEGRTRVNRRDWALNWNMALDAGGVLLGEQATLEFDVSAVKTAG